MLQKYKIAIIFAILVLSIIVSIFLGEVILRYVIYRPSDILRGSGTNNLRSEVELPQKQSDHITISHHDILNQNKAALNSILSDADCENGYYAVVDNHGKMLCAESNIHPIIGPPQSIYGRTRSFSAKKLLPDSSFCECLQTIPASSDSIASDTIMSSIVIAGKNYKVLKWVCADQCLAKDNMRAREPSEKSIVENVPNVGADDYDEMSELCLIWALQQQSTWWIYAVILMCLAVQLWVVGCFICFRKIKQFNLFLKKLTYVSEWTINIPPTFGVLGTIIAIAVSMQSLNNADGFKDIFISSFYVAVTTTVFGGIVYAINLILLSILSIYMDKSL